MKFSNLLLAGSLAFGLAACSSDTTEPTESENEVLEEVDQEELDKETNPEEAEEIEAETTEGDKYDGTIGDTLSFDNISITLDGVSYADAETVTSLEAGTELVYCEMSIANDTGETLDFDMKNFSMENNESVTSEPNGFEVNSSSDLIDGVIQVAAGETTMFRLSFIEPEGETPLILYYLKDTTTDSEQTLTWTINR